MKLTVDTSVLIAVLTSESEREMLVELTRGAELVAPSSVHWEVGNALSAMLRRTRITVDQCRDVLAAYERIPIRFVDVDIADALELAERHKLYAYDAYVIACAQTQRCGLLSLDRILCASAIREGVRVLEVKR
jgi:predicted nucleic acid-binding protein